MSIPSDAMGLIQWAHQMLDDHREQQVSLICFVDVLEPAIPYSYLHSLSAFVGYGKCSSWQLMGTQTSTSDQGWCLLSLGVDPTCMLFSRLHSLGEQRHHFPHH